MLKALSGAYSVSSVAMSNEHYDDLLARISLDEKTLLCMVCQLVDN